MCVTEFSQFSIESQKLFSNSCFFYTSCTHTDFMGTSMGPIALQSHLNVSYYKSVFCWPKGVHYQLYRILFEIWIIVQSDFLSSLIFCPVTDRQTESDVLEPTVHGHRWAQKNCAHCKLAAYLSPVFCFQVVHGSWLRLCWQGRLVENVPLSPVVHKRPSGKLGTETGLYRRTAILQLHRPPLQYKEFILGSWHACIEWVHNRLTFLVVVMHTMSGANWLDTSSEHVQSTNW